MLRSLSILLLVCILSGSVVAGETPIPPAPPAPPTPPCTENCTQQATGTSYPIPMIMVELLLTLIRP